MRHYTYLIRNRERYVILILMRYAIAKWEKQKGKAMLGMKCFQRSANRFRSGWALYPLLLLLPLAAQGVQTVEEY